MSDVQGHQYFRAPAARAVTALLAQAELPTSDLSDAHLQQFIGYGSDGDLQAVIGLELYPPVALLRSLAVASSARRKGLGTSLVARAERHAAAHGVREIYLLTTTAEGFFARGGYERISRASVPEAIRRTSEFASLCPVTAAVMRKRLA